ncbi:MAG TPA: RNA helicase, partial [Gammaproteobacteria bacterium]|nr:RNA helicase [Gammaproteobacteria bacterium]
HRIGRTGRGGASGIAISLVGPDDHGNLRGIERLVGRRLERSVIAGLEPKRSEPRHDRGQRKPQGRHTQGFKPHAGKPGQRGANRNERGFAPRAEHAGKRMEAAKGRNGAGGQHARTAQPGQNKRRHWSERMRSALD